MRRLVARVPISPKSFLTAGVLAIAVSFSAPAFAQVTLSAAETQVPYQLKVTSNLVVVRVVVRDAQGKPVENLSKDDFKLFDRGKTQSISQFSVETVARSQPSSSVVAGANSSAPGSSLPQRFVALYFDDLNASAGDMIRARDAADHYLLANVEPSDRVSIFTPGNMLSDFTSDPRQIHDALSKLHASPLARQAHDCPDLSDYQAEQIMEFDDEQIDSWRIAIDQALNDPRCSQVPSGPGEPQRYISVLARRVMEQSQLQNRANLQQLEKVVSYVSQKPGQRTVVLVSPGFLSHSEQPQLDQIIDQALRNRVVVSSLDPRGVANLLAEGSTARSYMPVFLPDAVHRLDSDRESAARGVLQEVAQGTGGEWVHNTNDLVGGFGVLAGSPGYYLAFAPTEMKLDGKFHDLKVELAVKHAGYTLQARRGYFAPHNEAEAEEFAKQSAAIDPDAQAKEQIREAIYSRTEVQQLPVTTEVKVFSTKTEDRELALSTSLDGKSLQLSKDGQRSLDRFTFVFAVFDQQNNLIQVQRGQSKPDTPYAELKMDSRFELKPGIYRLREVVTDSEEHRITVLSRSVDVSSECCASRELPSIPPAAGNQKAAQPVHTGEGSYLDFPLRKLKAAVPTLNGLKADPNQDQLAWILAKTGAATASSLAAAPNLTSLEDVYSLVSARDPGPTNSILGMEETPVLMDLESELLQARSVEFNYLLLFDHHADGTTGITELRTDFKNRQVASSAGGAGPRGFGFAYQWLLLSPANQSELHFRYLGQQRLDDHETFVLGFVQIPSQVKDPGTFRSAGKEAPFYFQGIAWIDRWTFNVVRLQTNLLGSVPSVNLREMTTDLRFRSVRIHGFGTTLWLPSEVLIRTEQTDTVANELHHYSGYRFFHAQSRLLPSAPR